MMPSFHGAAADAANAGLRVRTCHWCGGHVWWPADHELTGETLRAGRVFCPTRKCEAREGAARDEEAAVSR